MGRPYDPKTGETPAVAPAPPPPARVELVSGDGAAKEAYGGAAVDGKDGCGATALYAACMTGHADCAEFLFERGASVRVALQNGWTPLYVAAQAGAGVGLPRFERTHAPHTHARRRTGTWRL